MFGNCLNTIIFDNKLPLIVLKNHVFISQFFKFFDLLTRYQRCYLLAKILNVIKFEQRLP